MPGDLVVKLACRVVMSFIALPSAALSQEARASDLEAALIADDTAALVDIIKGQEIVMPLFVGRTPLIHRAVVSGSPSMVASLLNAGLPVDTQGPNGGSALTLAVEMGELETAELLVKHGADRLVVNEVGLTAAEIAALRGENRLAYKLLPPFTSERTRLAEAWLLDGAAQGDAEAMRLAQSAEADLAARTVEDKTILQIALASQSWPAIDFLINQPRSQRDSVLARDDSHRLLEFALSHREGSTEKEFAAQAIAALLRTGVLSVSMLSEGLDGFGSADDLEQVLRWIGVSQETMEIYFEQVEPSLPELEYGLPKFEPTGGIAPVHWKEVQELLAAEKLYVGAIDGIAGQGTYDAVSAYIFPLAEIMIARGRYASIKAREPSPGSRFGPTTFTRRNGYIERFRGERTPDYESIGYTVRHEDDWSRFSWSKGALPSSSSQPENFFGVFSVLCRDGAVTGISAPLLGSTFSIRLQEDASYTHYLEEKYERSIPVDAKVLCFTDDLMQ